MSATFLTLDIFRKVLKTHFLSLAFNVHKHLRDICTAPMAAICNRRTINPDYDDDAGYR